MNDPPYVLQEAGLSPAEPPEDPDAPKGRLTWLWAVLAMGAIVGVGGAISVVSQRYAENEPPLDPDQAINTEQAADLCRDAMFELGIEEFTVPPYIPAPDGSNLQTPLPWRAGVTIMIVPIRAMASEGSFSALPMRTVKCTIDR
ncbi:MULTISPECIES: hypothetical protein [unclassified Nocardioides]|uniref:hypothetical protein n=1 Tax=unclassified Nocardioides TaxID=2615069 RepID=UPI0006FDFE9F|nr:MULTISPECIES: hypothetical protein [unclassified Nocardioides]KQY64632.1 hypothetical protein ASD30_06910 [Nocardioides sp. Root140]KRF12536.1 hypothetical protein ASH02_13265 [Nocardioides sp. Soil796]